MVNHRQDRVLPKSLTGSGSPIFHGSCPPVCPFISRWLVLVTWRQKQKTLGVYARVFVGSNRLQFDLLRPPPILQAIATQPLSSQCGCLIDLSEVHHNHNCSDFIYTCQPLLGCHYPAYRSHHSRDATDISQLLH